MSSHNYPITWRILDRAEAITAVWPKRWASLTGYLLLVPALLLVFVLVIGFAYIFEYSLHELDIATYRLKDDYSLINYLAFFKSTAYQKVVLRSLAASAIVTVITVFLAFPYGYVMVRAKSAFTRKFLLICLFLPFFIGQVVRAYGWLIILGKEGLLNTFLTSLGLPMVDLIYNYPAVLLGLVQYMLPFAVLLISPAITAISEDFELASEGLGANWIQTFRHVVIPMALPGIIGSSVVVFTLTLTDFAMPEILGGGTTDFIANSIYDGFFQISNPGLGAALAMILVTLGSAFVTVIFAMAGTGTLGFSGEGPMTGARSKKIALWSIVWFNLITLSLPTVIILGASFTAGDIVKFPPDGFSLKWYEQLWLLEDFKDAFLRTFYVSAICTVVSIPAGTLAAIALARYRVRFRTTLQVYLLLPFTIPLVVSGLGMMIVFGEVRILGQLWPVGIALCIINLPFMIWAVSATVNALDDELENAAANCGAPPLQAFLTVTLPAVMPGVITGALLMFILAFNEFLVSLFLTDARIVTLPVSIYNSIRSVITPDLAAVSVVYIVVAFFAVWLLDKLVGLELFLKSK